MTAYLIETYGSATPAVADADQLAAQLAADIEHAHYSGDGVSTVRLFRYDDGRLTPLSVHRVGEQADSYDYLWWAYEVRADAPAAPVEAAFTVCIDGRA